MEVGNEVGYKPPPEFQEYAKDPLTELSLTESTELWLIQWPINQTPDFDGKEVTLKLHHDGHLGSFQGSSGKSYDVVSFASQEPDAAVFLSSKSDSKIVGKISRRVSLVHYPEPNELQQPNTKNPNRLYQNSSRTSLTNSSHHFATPSRGSRQRSSLSAVGNGVQMRSGRQRSSLTEGFEPSTPSSKRKKSDDPTRSLDRSTQDPERDVHSAVTSLASLEHSNESKSKRRKKNHE